ncbi:MAG: ribose 5-phosphate isomerase B [Clostridia bacterium]|nr:ribose 5-phosphate isomerase B [Clostridia bacterium]
MKIAISSDHGGFELKGVICDYLTKKGHTVTDLGTNSPESCDYADYAEKCAHAVTSGEAELGILVCGTGIGISIAANKIKGIRCALCYSPETAALAKEHNNANIIAFGGRTMSEQSVLASIDAYLNTEFAGGRHQRRIDKIAALEQR